MISTAPVLTDAGKDLLIRAIGGEQIFFTRFKVGNGELGAESPQSQTDLLNIVHDFAIENAVTSSEGYLQLSGSFMSSDLESDFIWRELGVFAKGEDDVEILYAYANDGVNASVIRASVPDVVVEQNVNVIVAIGTAQNVTAIISQNALYASKDDFDKHVNDKNNPHGITAKDLGLDQVPNLPTNDQTVTYELPEATVTQPLTSGEKMSVAFGKIARAILNFIAHLADQTNPHKVTAEQAGAASKTHTHGASDINAGTLSVERGGTGAANAENARTNLGAAAATHTHAASDVSEGTLAGKVQANATAMEAIDAAQLRDIYAGTTDLTAGTSELATGTLYFVYE